MVTGRTFSGEFKREAVRLVKERSDKPARDLDLHENALPKWVRGLALDPVLGLPNIDPRYIMLIDGTGFRPTRG